jgi:hypothetical protein
MPADTDALSLLPRGDAWAHFIDYAGDFVSWNAGVLNAGPSAFFREHVAVADATSLHLDANLSSLGLRNLALDDFEISSRLGNRRRFHGRYSNSCSCHVAVDSFPQAGVSHLVKDVLLLTRSE